MYHRIAEPAVDPWELSVSAQNFDQQLEVLKKTGLVIPLQDLAAQLYSGLPLRPSILITFDDGYADNYLTAKPLLEKYDLPATFFISSKNIDSANEFWWDELADMILQTRVLPQKLVFKTEHTDFYFDLENENVLSNESLAGYREWSVFGKNNCLRSQL